MLGRGNPPVRQPVGAQLAVYSFSGLPPGNLGVVAIRRGTTASPQRFQAREGDSFTADFVPPE